MLQDQIATLRGARRHMARGQRSARRLRHLGADETDEIFIVLARIAMPPPPAFNSGARAIDKRHDADAQHAGQDRLSRRIIISGRACFVFAGDGRAQDGHPSDEIQALTPKGDGRIPYRRGIKCDRRISLKL
jgi:hypothetical protein